MYHQKPGPLLQMELKVLPPQNKTLEILQGYILRAVFPSTATVSPLEAESEMHEQGVTLSEC